MKKYIDLLNELQKLSKEQLECDIKLLSNGELIDQNVEIVVDADPLYLFNDTNLDNYHAFENEENAKEYVCEMILEKNYPIIELS